jgi:hypothetical protein
MTVLKMTHLKKRNSEIVTASIKRLLEKRNSKAAAVSAGKVPNGRNSALLPLGKKRLLERGNNKMKMVSRMKTFDGRNT